MTKSKDAIFDALDILNKINMDYEKFIADCSKCRALKLGNIQNSCNIEGYCPAFLSDREINTLNRNFN